MMLRTAQRVWSRPHTLQSPRRHLLTAALLLLLQASTSPSWSLQVPAPTTSPPKTVTATEADDAATLDPPTPPPRPPPHVRRAQPRGSGKPAASESVECFSWEGDCHHWESRDWGPWICEEVSCAAMHRHLSRRTARGPRVA
eukprot:scaffold3187_cov361-Prasinococcus_capsulatus_cf.AAC.7